MVAALLETMEIKTEDQYATCLAAWRAGPTSLSGWYSSSCCMMLVIRCIRLHGGLPWGASWCSKSWCKAALILSASLTICVMEGIGWDKMLWISSRDFRAPTTSERSVSCKTKMSHNWNYKRSKSSLLTCSHLLKKMSLVLYTCERKSLTWLINTTDTHFYLYLLLGLAQWNNNIFNAMLTL